MNRLPFSFFLLLLLSSVSCTKENVEKTIFGEFEGQRSDGVEVEKWRISQSDTADFTITFHGMGQPFLRTSGSLVDGTIELAPVECVQCEGLPSPGGNKRYFSQYLSGSGECQDNGASVVLHLSFEQSGDFGSEKFLGQVILTKI